MATPSIISREQLWRLLDDRMRSTYESLLDKEALDADSSLVKTYLLEAHAPQNSAPADVLSLLNDVTARRAEADPDIRVRQTDDPLFFDVRAKVRGGQVSLFVDASNPRFWVAHSANTSKNVDGLVARLTSSPRLDRAWLFSSLLQQVTALGKFRGLGLAFDRRGLVPEREDTRSVDFLKMQLWGNQASDVLGTLRDKFPGATTLSKVKIKYAVDPSDAGQFTIDDIKFNGKVTARGTSFSSHANLVDSVYRRYIETVTMLEEQYRLSWTSSERRLSLDGQPVSFYFPQPIADLDAFAERVFTGGEPFRLWGTPIRIDENVLRVSCLDLHVGARLRFEITPEFVRMFLLANSCGNTVTRFFTNLQHFYDARIEALNGDGERIL